jgi:hypothetical protein
MTTYTFKKRGGKRIRKKSRKRGGRRYAPKRSSSRSKGSKSRRSGSGSRRSLSRSKSRRSLSRSKSRRSLSRSKSRRSLSRSKSHVLKTSNKLEKTKLEKTKLEKTKLEKIKKQKFILLIPGKKTYKIVSYHTWLDWVIKNCPKDSEFENLSIKKGGSKKMILQYGGVKISAKHLTWFINVCIGLFIGYSIWTVPVGLATAVAGFKAVANGGCNTTSNYIWSVLGLRNPVCQTYHMILRLVDRALWERQPDAIAQVIGYIVLAIKAPSTAVYCKRKATFILADRILKPTDLIELHELDILQAQIDGVNPGNMLTSGQRDEMRTVAAREGLIDILD